MPYRNISKRNAVIKAINEFIELGQEAFLVKYKGGRALRYFLLYKGQHYDCRSILRAAYEYQFGDQIPSHRMNNPNTTISDVLERLGFCVLDNKVDNMFANSSEEVPNESWEGTRRAVMNNVYERSRSARLACIKHYGAKCAVCNFDFSIVYGENFEGYIQVHHIFPLSKVTSRYKVDPIKHLIPLCANCHAVVHFKGETRSIEFVKKLLKHI